MSSDCKGMNSTDIFKNCRKSAKSEIFKNALELNPLMLDR